MRWLVVSCVVVLGLCAAPRAAHARRGFLVVVNTGDDITYVRDVPAETSLGFTKLGYHYSRFGVFWLDLWRWGGEFVLYDGGSLYVPLTDEDVEAIGGASVPWKYHAPPGLLVLLAAVELGIVTLRKRRAGRMIVLGAVWIVVGLVLWLGGVDAAFVVPVALGLHHVVGSWLAIRLQARLEAVESPAAPEPTPEPAREPERHVPLRPPPPNVETDPFRAPPQPPPIIVARPSAPTRAPVVADANAEPPKLLR